MRRSQPPAPPLRHGARAAGSGGGQRRRELRLPAPRRGHGHGSLRGRLGGGCRGEPPPAHRRPARARRRRPPRSDPRRSYPAASRRRQRTAPDRDRLLRRRRRPADASRSSPGHAPARGQRRGSRRELPRIDVANATLYLLAPESTGSKRRRQLSQLVVRQGAAEVVTERGSVECGRLRGDDRRRWAAADRPAPAKADSSGGPGLRKRKRADGPLRRLLARLRRFRPRRVRHLGLGRLLLGLAPRGGFGLAAVLERALGLHGLTWVSYDPWGWSAAPLRDLVALSRLAGSVPRLHLLSRLGLLVLGRPVGGLVPGRLLHPPTVVPLWSAGFRWGPYGWAGGGFELWSHWSFSPPPHPRPPGSPPSPLAGPRGRARLGRPTLPGAS